MRSGQRYSGTVAGFMNTIGNLGQMISIPVVAWLAVLAGEPGHPSWKVSLYFNAAMFFIAALSWLFVNPSESSSMPRQAMRGSNAT